MHLILNKYTSTLTMFPNLKIEPKLKPWAKYAPYVHSNILER